MITIRPNPLPKFKILYNLPPKTWLVINVGGRGGGKSYEVSKWGVLEALTRNKRLALLRDEQSTIAQSIMHEIKMRFTEINEKANNHFSSRWEMQDNGLKKSSTGMLHVFSKGFRTSKTGQKAGLKSIADVDIAIVEEFEDIADEEKFNVFADSIRKEDAVIVINSNVPSKNHWFVKRYFNLIESPYEGFYILQPKTIPGVVYIISSYEDNPHLSENTISRYRAYGDPNSNLYNLEHYITDILGYVSEGAKGRIYRGWKAITNTEFLQAPYSSYYGLDFGYSEDPVALVEIKSHNNKNFWKEIIYEVGLTNPSLAKLMQVRGVPKNARIYADSAEPKSIKELHELGYKNVVPADKGPDSVLFGIKQVKAMENYVTEGSANLWHENEEYKWELDSNKEPTDKPEDKNNHLLDAGRYAITTHKHKNKGFAIGNTSEPSPLDWIE
jgi:phage terminase large subunit